MESLINASKGMSQSRGGLNIPEFINAIVNFFPETDIKELSSLSRPALNQKATMLLSKQRVINVSPLKPLSLSPPLKPLEPSPPKVKVASPFKPKVPSPLNLKTREIKYKPVYFKNDKGTMRLSARGYYDKFIADGKDPENTRCNIRPSINEYKCLKISNRSPKWMGCSDNYKKCLDPDFN